MNAPRSSKTATRLITVLVALLFSVASANVCQGSTLEAEKERTLLDQLESLGLGTDDPALSAASSQANALMEIDVTTSGDKTVIVLRTADEPVYIPVMLRDENKFIVDLQNTVNLHEGTFLASHSEVIGSIRSSFEVEPVTARITVNLKDNAFPEIYEEENQITICFSEPIVERADVTESTELPAELPPPAQVEDQAPTEAVEQVELAAAPERAVEEELVLVSRITLPPVEKTMADAEEPVERALIAMVDEPVLDEGEPAAEDVAEEEAVSEPEPLPAAEEEEMEEPAAEAEEPAPEPVEEAQVAEITPTEPVEEVVAEQVEEEVAETPLPEIEVVAEQTVPEPTPPAIEAPIEAPVEVVEEKVVVALPAPEETPEPLPNSPDKTLEQIMDDRQVSLTFRDADIRAVLDILARKAEANILAGKDVTGEVTARLTDVSVATALESILNMNGYGYFIDKNIIKVVPLSQIAGQTVDTATETYDLSYAEVSDIKNVIQRFVTQYGAVETDDRTNMLIVTDVPGNFDKLNGLIKKLDKRIEQVMIEVMIVDSLLEDAAELGLSWDLILRGDNTPLFGSAGDGFSLLETMRASSKAASFFFATTKGDLSVGAIVDAWARDNKVKILANPKILTLDNETAYIEIVNEFPFVDTMQTTEGGFLTNVTYKEIGTKLSVTPQITNDGYVILTVAPEESAFGEEPTAGEAPVVNTRKAETTLLVKDGQTIVLGGLRRYDTGKTIIKVPLFGDLPILKYIFRKVRAGDTATELLVFITTHIWGTAPLDEHEIVKYNELELKRGDINTEVELIK